MRLINIVDSTSDMNYGIWHAAVVNASALAASGYSVELWFPTEMPAVTKAVTAVQLAGTDQSVLTKLVHERKLDPSKDIIITHGVWNYPTRWGHTLKQLGFRWIYVPQGMLEPWPLKQKWLKKKIYFNLVEQRLAKKADLIRAVAKPEMNNLRRFFPSSDIRFIPNGVQVQDTVTSVNTVKRKFLYLSRLHHKKNIVNLVKAWIASKLNNDPSFEFNIIGPDQGELQAIKGLLKQSSNAYYRGVIFGSEKLDYFAQSSFYVLPSFSEGLPSALLEAMGNGLIPVITEGCNLPDVGELQLGILVGTDANSIREGLEKAGFLPAASISDLREKNRMFIQDRFSIEAITKLQLQFYPGKNESSSVS